MIRVRPKISSGVQLKCQLSQRYSKTLCLATSMVLKSLAAIRPSESSCIRLSGASTWARETRSWIRAKLMKSFYKMLIHKGWVTAPIISGRISILASLMTSELQISKNSQCKICKLKTLLYPRRSRLFKSKCKQFSSNWNPMQSVALKLKSYKDALQRRHKTWRRVLLCTQAL